MGFISSLLCCSTPKQDNKKNSAEIISPSADRKKVQAGSKNVNKRPKEQLPLKQSSGNKHNTLTDSTKLKGKSWPNARSASVGTAGGIVSLAGVNVLSSSKRTMTEDEYSTAKTGSPSASAGYAGGKVISAGSYSDKNVNSRQHPRRNRGGHKDALGLHSDTTDRAKTDDINGAGSSGYIEDEDLDDGDASTDKETFFGDKRTVTVYQGETDTSTGSTDDDKQDCTNVTAHEVTAVLQNTRHSIAIDEDPSNKSVQDAGCNDLDVEINKTDYASDIIMDLATLQPEQSHAPGYSTLLPPQAQPLNGRKCLVLDLDETLVHSSFKYLHTADFVIPVEIDNQVHNVYVIKRPGVDEFLKRVGELYEVVIFTASVSRYGDPLLDILDSNSSVHHRLFRDSCYNYEGNYIKNLSQIGRPLSDLIILDNSPASYIFHPQHAIPISSWFSDAHDNELLDILPLLEDLASEKVLDVGRVLDVTI